MKRTICFGCLLAALLGGCDSKWHPREANPTSSALPVLPRPVGTVPGPGDATQLPDNPYANDQKAIQDGRTLFVRMNCSGCHGGRAGGGMGPSLRDPMWRYGKLPSDIFDSVAQGRGMGMPAWGTKLPEQQIWMIVAYIQSLGTDHEPDAP